MTKTPSCSSLNKLKKPPQKMRRFQKKQKFKILFINHIQDFDRKVQERPKAPAME